MLMARIAMLGTGLIGGFYTEALQGKRGRDQVTVAHGRDPERTKAFAEKWNIPRWTTDLAEAVRDPEADTVVIGLPNHLHKDAVSLAAEAKKAVLCTKPLARNAVEAREILEIVEKAGVFHGYLEDLVYTPKTMKAIAAVRQGTVGKVLWTRSREAHPGPHSDWFWNSDLSGGGAIVDLGCHCIEIGRSFVGKDVRPLEVVCWGDTQVHPIDAEDHAVGLVRYASGAVAQFEVAWTFRGGMDLGGPGGYVAEKSESETGWMFPVGDEAVALGYEDMFADMLEALENGRPPIETFYDGYVVNAIMDAAYRSMESKRWEPVTLDVWRGAEGGDEKAGATAYDEHYDLIKRERMPDGRVKLILKDRKSGEVVQRIE
jgi:predicted dehydrogenase